MAATGDYVVAAINVENGEFLGWLRLSYGGVFYDDKSHARLAVQVAEDEWYGRNLWHGVKVCYEVMRCPESGVLPT